MFEPRKYQTTAYRRTLEITKNGGHSLIILATGTGKTEVAGMLTKTFNKQGKNVLFIAHRGLLLDQADNKLLKHTKVHPMREQGKLRADWGSCNITASIQTLKGQRLRDIDPKSIDVIIVDECHRSTAKTYQDVFEHFKDAVRIGLTATADRSDSKSLFPIFTEIALQYSLSKAIRENYLCRLTGKKVEGFDIDLNGLKISNGDFSNEDEIGDLIEKYLAPISENIKKETVERSKVLLFMPNVHSSKLIAETMQKIGLNADYVSGDRKDNNIVLSRFKAGEIKYLASCMLLIEGYDEPAIDCVVMLRPTSSRVMYSQAVGRGTRLSPGKTDLLLLEFTYNSETLNLVTAYELLEDAYDERMIEEAKKRPSSDIDFLDELENIEKTFYSIDNIMERAVSKDFTFNNFNPVDISAMLDIDNEVDAWFHGKKLDGEITPKQKELLDRYMIDTSGLNKATASRILSRLIDNGNFPHSGGVTNSQLNYLSSLCHKKMPDNLTKAAASLLISEKKRLE